MVIERSLANTQPGDRWNQNYIPALDGIRGIAILLVVTYHYLGFIKLFSLGWAGVDLFFVLSGYLITSRLVATRDKPKYFRNFYFNRILRIFPVYFLALAIFYLAITIYVSKSEVHYFDFYFKNWWAFVFFIQNWVYIIFGFSPENHLQHFWSLAIEEQFYLFWPLVLYFILSSKRLISIGWISILFVICLRILIYNSNPDNPLSYFCNTFCRMDSFIIGGLLFIYRLKNNKRIPILLHLVILGALVLGILFTNTSSSNLFFGTIGYTVIAFQFAGLIDLAITRRLWGLTILCENTLIRFVGKISYGLYIFHWPVLVILHSRLRDLFQNYKSLENLANPLSLILCFIISIGVSIISYFYFERYFLRLKKKPANTLSIFKND